MQAFYVKKEKKLSNVYHKLKVEINHFFYKNMKDNEIKAILIMILNLFFQGTPDKTINLKRAN